MRQPRRSCSCSPRSLAGPVVRAKDEGCEIANVARVVAIGDVHGAYPEFLAVLRLAGLDRREGPLGGRQDPLRPDRRHPRPRDRDAAGDGAADAARGRGEEGGRARARPARQPRGDERARRPALREPGGVQGVRDARLARDVGRLLPLALGRRAPGREGRPSSRSTRRRSARSSRRTRRSASSSGSRRSRTRGATASGCASGAGW